MFKAALQRAIGSESDGDLEKDLEDQPSKPSIRQEHTLNDKEKQFLIAVERGDMVTMTSFLEQAEDDKTIDINCRDALGRTALLIAIEYESTDMMKVLLSYNVKIHDALLHAINEECVDAFEILLKHNNEQKFKRRGALRSMGDVVQQIMLQTKEKEEESDLFTPDITPLILAAHKDNYEIIKTLLESGHTITKPHSVQCGCKDCICNGAGDTLCHSRSRINAYKALASPSLICLSSQDPILTAFELSWELRKLSKLEHEFKGTYIKLSQQTSSFATELLDQTRGSEELEVILNHGGESWAREDDEKGMTLERLRLAIRYKQKEFVAHPHCQQLLSSIWYEGLPGFRRRHITYKILMTCGVCMLTPLWSILYMVAPKSRFGRLMRQPFIKFIVHSASYCIFLFLLILTSQRIEFTATGSSHEYKVTDERRGPPPTTVEWLIFLFVIGLLWAEVKQLWDLGLQDYVRDMWNLLDFTTNTLYITTITLRLISYFKVQDEIRLGLPSADIPRSNWHPYDPNLIAEALFAAANTFSTLKLVYIFTINPYLGPLQISLGRMIIDITKWAVVSVLVLFSFACGLNQLLWYYSEANAMRCKDETYQALECNSKFSRYFTNLFQIIQTLYWAMFGLVDLDSITLHEKHKFTEFAGRLMFGAYSYIVVIVLLNMLIAMMNNSYQIISSQADGEWKFARSKLWLSYFEEGGTLPAPFNMLPSLKTIWHFILWVKATLCQCSKKIKQNKWLKTAKMLKKKANCESRYQEVMRNLIKRYIMNKSRMKVDEGVKEDDINEMKQEISAFRFELIEILKNNGMSIPERDLQKKPKNLGNAMKLKRKHSYMKQWPKHGAKSEEKPAALGSPSSMTTIDETEFVNSSENRSDSGSSTRLNSSESLSELVRLTSGQEGSENKLQRSQSAVSFHSAAREDSRNKYTCRTTPTFPAGSILRHFIRSRRPGSLKGLSSELEDTSTEVFEENSSARRIGISNKDSTRAKDGQRSAPECEQRNIFTLSEESD